QSPQLIAAQAKVITPSLPETVTPGIVEIEPAKLNPVSPSTPTPRSEALKLAREGSGRMDPFAPCKTITSFAENEPALTQTKEAKTAFKVPPPPPGFVAPPPPSEENALNFSELPKPPSRVQVAQKLELTGIVGERAIFAVTDPAYIRQSGVARTVSLAPGDRFESVTLQSLAPDSVVLEEDGEKTVRSLP